MKHNIKRNKGGEGITGWIQPVCSCGWHGSTHYAHNDYQHSNVTEEENSHLQDNTTPGEVEQ